MTKRFYITTPIYYVNGAPHIGHAYTSIATDVLARWKRLDGFDVFFLTGTDEHGQKVEQAAAAAGLDPQSFTDKVSADFQDMTRKMGVSNDQWIRTTEDRHKRSCAELWRRIEAAGDIYLGHYEGWYAVRDEAFYDEAELTTAPDGKKTAPSGAPVEWVREPSYFFRLAAWQDRLLKFYEEHPEFIAPSSRRNEVISFVRGGLRDLSISRTTFRWGIPVPGAPDHVMYVWLDALEQLRHGLRLSGRDRSALALLAGRRAHGRQGHHPFPRRVLAGVPDVRRPAAATPGILARLVGGRRREDVQVARQRGRAAQAGGDLRARPGALLPAAGKAVRRGRLDEPPGDRHADQRRAGQRPRQLGAAHAVADRAQLRRGAAGRRGRGRAPHRGRRGHARCRRRVCRRCCVAAWTSRPSTRRWRRCGR